MLEKRAFYIGLMFDRAAVLHGNTPITLDTPLQLAPEDGTDLTVNQVARHVRRLSAWLRAAGVRRGDRVAVYKTDNFDIAVLASAVQRIGAVPALLSPVLDSEIVPVLLKRLDRPWLITDRPKLDLTGLDVSLARGVLLSAGEELPGAVAYSGFAGVPEVEAVVPPRLEPALITHTSGTTGPPKLVVQTAKALWYRLLPQSIVSGRIWRHESVALSMSFVHARFYSALNLAVAYGNPLVVAVDSSPANIAALFLKTRPGAVETQPNTFVSWEALAEDRRWPLASVRYYSATFDAIHPRTIQVLLGASERRSPRFFQMYGQTETGPVTGNCYSLRSVHHTDSRCVGWPFPGVARLRIVDDEGRPVKRGEVGSIEVRSQTRALTYLGEEERFVQQLNDGWWGMGDVGFKDRWGRVHLLDREIDRLDSVDSNLEIEDELMSRLHELREVVIVAGPDDRALPIVCTRDDAPLDEERWQLATAGMPKMALPKQIPFEKLPKTATWKIRRPDLVCLLKDGIYD
jgi:acyl-coenzyme A synthetase/AMP-(fatty) acid ligase